MRAQVRWAIAGLSAGLGLLCSAPSHAQPEARTPQAAAAETRPPLIPVSTFAQNNLFGNPLMAPDGRHVAVSFTVEDETGVSVLDVTTRKAVAQARLSEDVEYNWHRWAGPDVVLISVSQLIDYHAEEVRFSRLVALRVSTGARWFVGPKNMGVEGDDLLHVAPDGSSVLLSFQKSIYEWPSVTRISLSDPEDKGELVQRPVDTIWEWYADDAGVVRMGTGWVNNRLRVTYRKSAADRFREIARIHEDDENKIWDVRRIISGSDEGYVLDEDADGRVVLARYDLSTRTRIETVHKNPDWDIESAWLDDVGKPLAVDFTDDRDRRQWLDPVMGKLQAQLEKALKVDEVWIVSRARDGSKMLVFAGGETDPGVYYVYDAKRRALDAFAVLRPGIDSALMVRPRPVSYSARDGTRISAYLTLPRGRAAKGLPLIIMPHGGPYGVRDKLVYDDEVQLLANRGYAVLQPNYRGSGGYGTAFEEKGDGQIGRAMQNDLDDAMDWAVKEGIAAKDRVCVVGASYGGYAAMWAVIRNPERYRCAASFAGVTDWKKILRYDAKYFSRKGARAW